MSIDSAFWIGVSSVGIALILVIAINVITDWRRR